MKLHVPVHFNIIDESHFTVSYLGHDKHYANIFQVNDLFSKGNNSSSICFTSSRSFVMVKVNRIKVMTFDTIKTVHWQKTCISDCQTISIAHSYISVGGAFDKRNGETWVWILELYCWKGRWRSKLSSSKFYSLGRVGAWGALVSIIICTILMHVYKRGP